MEENAKAWVYENVKANNSLALIYGKGNPDNTTWQIRAIVDANMVAWRKWESNGWRYQIDPISSFVIMRSNGILFNFEEVANHG